jgi:hypothetical protein
MRILLLQPGGRDVHVGNRKVSRIGGTCRSVRLGPAKSAFICVGLEQGTNQRYISPLPAIRSSSQTDVFVAKDAASWLLVY